MPDPLFADRRLARLYDPFDPDRSDLDVYAAMVEELVDGPGGRVLDVGCGTGTFACLLAARGFEVTGVDPAAASLELARAKPHADGVRWLLGDATVLDEHPPLEAHAATMTANVAQVFLTDEELAATLEAVRRSLRRGGWLVLETRVPEREAWREWVPEHTRTSAVVDGEGLVETWCELVDVSLPLVSFRWTTRFGSDGAELASDSTLRFWSREEMAAALVRGGFDVAEVRDAPDRPGREWVFLARRGPGRRPGSVLRGRSG